MPSRNCLYPLWYLRRPNAKRPQNLYSTACTLGNFTFYCNLHWMFGKDVYQNHVKNLLDFYQTFDSWIIFTNCARITSICDMFIVLFTMYLSLHSVMTVILLVLSKTVLMYVSTSFHTPLTMCVQSFQYFLTFISLTLLDRTDFLE